MNESRTQLNIVIIGHVDHGKSTLLGRLLADADFLPEGKLESVKAYCEKNAKTFEYAFLLDALKEEQSQGITIDAARCFFKTKKRDYLIIDAPGHFEFVKNMVTGASRADAAIVVIDAKEGIRENTKRHGYLLSILGLENVCVAVNKMDLVEYQKDIFDRISNEYSKFLSSIGIKNISFIPVSARNGKNVVNRSENMSWYAGRTILEEIESWDIKSDGSSFPFRFFVHDVYKFTSKDDERRILAGTIDYGEIKTDDSVIFYPSGKKTEIESIEFYPVKLDKAIAGQSVGFIIKDKFFYVSSGEMMVKASEKPPYVSRRFKANIFWMEVAPLLVGKPYLAKIGTQKVSVRIVEIHKIIDAIDPQNIIKKNKLDRYDIAVCSVESLKPVVFDTIESFKKTARFVVINQYHIAGCGIIIEKEDDRLISLEKEIKEREKLWDNGYVSKEKREFKNKHKGKFILINGEDHEKIGEVAKQLEKRLFESGKNAYFLSLNSLKSGLDKDISFEEENRNEELRRLGEIAHIMTDAGLIFISYVSGLDRYEMEFLTLLNSPYEILTINIGKEKRGEYSLEIEEDKDIEEILIEIIKHLGKIEIIDYYI